MAARRQQCRACNSPRRGEIDRRLTEGQPSRKVSAWLKAAHGEQISFAALSAHKRGHIEVVQAARAKIEAEAAEAEQAGVEKLVADVHLLDQIAAHAMDAVKRLQPSMGRPTMPQAATYTGALREAREAVKLRDELLRENKPTAAAVPAGNRVTVAYAPGLQPLTDADSAQQAAEPGTPAPPAG